MTKKLAIGALLLLTGCPDMRGSPGYSCRPDGTCNGPALECAPTERSASGIPYGTPYCWPRAKSLPAPEPKPPEEGDKP